MRLLDFQKHFPTDLKMHLCVTSRNIALFPEFLKSEAKIIIVPVKRGYLEFNKAWKIYNFIKTHDISIVNSFALKELFLSIAIKAFSCWKIKVVYHSVENFDYFGIIKKFAFRALLKSTNRVVCNSKKLELHLKKLPVHEKKITRIPNGISTKFFENSGYKQKNLFHNNSSRNPIIIGTIANFRKEKNYLFLIKAFIILYRKYSNLRLLCVGGGYLLQEMKNLAKSLNLEKQIIFTGYSKDIVKYLSSMDFFVLCSEREGFPNVLLQAMSMEIPVLSANVGGCPEIIDHMKNGLLYPSNNLKKFITSLETLIENRDFASKLAANGRKTIEKKFSLERMTADYFDFYKELSRCEK